MTITLTTSYRDTFAPETVALIDKLQEDQFELVAMLAFIDEQNEEDFREFYEEYVELGENYGYEPVDVFLKEVGDPSDLRYFDSAYVGEYDSPEDFAEEYCSEEAERLWYIQPDWTETASFILDHDVDQYGDFYFRTNW